VSVVPPGARQRAGVPGSGRGRPAVLAMQTDREPALKPKDPAATDQFTVPALVSLSERRPRTLKHGDMFGVFDHNGDVVCAPGNPEGLFHRDTRHLSHFVLTMEGKRPMLFSSTMDDHSATLTCDLTNPDLFDATGQLVLEHDLLHLRRSRFLWNGACHERLTLRNSSARRHRARIELAFAADFADLFEVRGSVRARRGQAATAVVSQQLVELVYMGLDGARRTTTLWFDPPPRALDAARAAFAFDLAPGAVRGMLLQLCCNGMAEPPARRHFASAVRAARGTLRRSSLRSTIIRTSNEVFNETLRRSVADLGMLLTETPHGPYPYAGIPWFSTVFGRDALITALQTLWFDPAIARGVLGHLAANQATGFDQASDAEPGKILHEMRHGEMAALGEIPFGRYYGSVDATPLFVMLAGAYLGRTGDVATLRRLWPHVEAALDLMETRGDRDGDGFIEYLRQTESGLVNQGWKDNHDTIFHADGSLAVGPVALVEVQAYAYGAWRAAATIARALGQVDHAAGFDRRADELRTSFDAAFYDPALGCYVLALDGSKRPCRVKSSNAGHALLTGIALPERAARVAATLMEPSLFCGWGVRTIASTESRYNPISYHNGSVWPHDNALVAMGLARYGFRRQAARVLEGMFAASTYVDLRSLPELFCGFARQSARGPTFYPVACTPQAWAASAPLFMLQACLGLGFDPAQRQVTFDHPVLPEFLDEAALEGVCLQGAALDVALRRSGTQVVVDVRRRQGTLKVLTTS